MRMDLMLMNIYFYGPAEGFRWSAGGFFQNTIIENAFCGNEQQGAAMSSNAPKIITIAISGIKSFR